jgi:hypothetical protein
VGASRAVRLHVAMCDRLNMLDMAISDPTRSGVAPPAPSIAFAPRLSSDKEVLASCRFCSPVLGPFLAAPAPGLQAPR